MRLAVMVRVICLVSVLAAILPSAAMASDQAIVSPTGATTTSFFTAAQFTMNTTRRTLNCTTASMTATLASATGVFPLSISTNAQLAFSGCRVVGGLNITVTCGNTETWAVTGSTVSSTTPGKLSGINCLASASGAPSCSVRIAGSTLLSYYTASPQRLTLQTFGQFLVASGSTCATLPNDSSVTLGAAVAGDLMGFTSPATLIIGV